MYKRSTKAFRRAFATWSDLVPGTRTYYKTCVRVACGRSYTRTRTRTRAAACAERSRALSLN